MYVCCGGLIRSVRLRGREWAGWLIPSNLGLPRYRHLPSLFYAEIVDSIVGVADYNLRYILRYGVRAPPNPKAPG